jgi:prephenate dehydrogenase
MKEKTFFICGYKGEIGSFILNGLLRVLPKALNIFCSDINETKEEVEHRIKVSDVIFLCVPMQMTVDWIVKYKELLVGKTIIEQCSLKEWIYEDVRLRGLDIRSMHILFRPSQTPDYVDREVAVFLHPQLDNDMELMIQDITKAGSMVWYRDAKEHDMEMALQQALVHRTLLTLGDMLKGCKGSTFICKRVIQLSDRIKKGNRDLYNLIQSNKYLPEHIREINEKIDNFDINKCLDKGDK